MAKQIKVKKSHVPLKKLLMDQGTNEQLRADLVRRLRLKREELQSEIKGRQAAYFELMEDINTLERLDV